MPSTIIGMQEKKLRLSRRLLFREPVGLERIQEEYVFQTQDFDYFSNTVFLNGKTHSSVASFVAWAAGEEISYDTMVIERIEYQPEQGGLTLAIITYVGLYSTQRPSPIIAIEPILDRNWLFNNYAAIVRFVTPLGSPGSRSEITAISSTYARGTIHTSINGTPIPQGLNGGAGVFDVESPLLKWNLTWISCPFFRYECFETGLEEPIQNLTRVKGSVYYNGFSVYGVSVERFGLYGVIRLDIRDQATYVIPEIYYNCGPSPFSLPSCTSYLNTPASANQTS